MTREFIAFHIFLIFLMSSVRMACEKNAVWRPVNIFRHSLLRREQSLPPCERKGNIVLFVRWWENKQLQR